MKKVSLTLALLLAGCSIKGPARAQLAALEPAPAFLADAADAVVAGPRVVWNEVLHDGGPIPAGDDLRHEFVLRNVGTDVLHIRRAKGS